MCDIKTEYMKTRLPFWEKLRDQQRESLIANSRTVRYKKDSMLHGGNGDFGVLMVRRGRVCVYTVSEEGREFALLRLFSGDACMLACEGIMDNVGFGIFISAESEADVIIINSRAFSDICKANMQAELYTRKLITKHFSDVVSNMQNMLQVSAERRLASYICEESDRTGSARVKTTHEQIAKHIGTAREVVSRTLKRLCADGILELERGVIIIRDRAGLRKLI